MSFHVKNVLSKAEWDCMFMKPGILHKREAWCLQEIGSGIEGQSEAWWKNVWSMTPRQEELRILGINKALKGGVIANGVQ